MVHERHITFPYVVNARQRDPKSTALPSKSTSRTCYPSERFSLFIGKCDKLSSTYLWGIIFSRLPSREITLYISNVTLRYGYTGVNDLPYLGLASLLGLLVPYYGDQVLGGADADKRRLTASGRRGM